MDFLETPRFNTEIRYGTQGGPEFSTEIITVTSGAEGRTANWEASRGRWDIGSDVYNRKQIDELIAFFRERRGKAGGFRFKDWSDWKVTADDGVMVTIPGDTTHLQLAKLYASGANTTFRRICKPVPGTVKVYLADVLMDPQPVIDYTTGKVTLAAGDYTWTGEFDVPARFDTDQFSCDFEAHRSSDKESFFTVPNLPIVEIATFTL